MIVKLTNEETGESIDVVEIPDTIKSPPISRLGIYKAFEEDTLMFLHNEHPTYADELTKIEFEYGVLDINNNGYQSYEIEPDKYKEVADKLAELIKRSLL